MTTTPPLPKLSELEAQILESAQLDSDADTADQLAAAQKSYRRAADRALALLDLRRLVQQSPVDVSGEEAERAEQAFYMADVDDPAIAEWITTALAAAGVSL